MRLIVAMTGATGAVYGIRILKALRQLGVERHLILNRWAEVTIVKETGLSGREVSAMASVVHSPDNQGATISSGSFRHDGMVIAPCSMKTLAGLRSGLPSACPLYLRPSRVDKRLFIETAIREAVIGISASLKVLYGSSHQTAGFQDCL
jgi:polyprenyl P-hydroxybenzoate/phenylacrylic acid decarboxylase-like protein